MVPSRNGYSALDGTLKVPTNRFITRTDERTDERTGEERGGQWDGGGR